LEATQGSAEGGRALGTKKRKGRNIWKTLDKQTAIDYNPTQLPFCQKRKPMESPTLQRTRLAAGALSLVVAVALMTVKFQAWRLTGSSAIFSDALESIINVIAGGFALTSIWIAARPPDEDHPYGHGKIEYFSAGFEGALIILAALGIFYTGGGRILHPQPMPHLDTGLWLVGAAALVNGLTGILLLRIGRRTRSLTLEADGRHLLTDVYTSVGVVVGLVVVKLTGRLWLDGLVACLVGLQILATGGRLVREAVFGLMDRTDPVLIDRLAAHLNAHRRPYWIDIHELRCRQAGRMTHLSLHLILPRDLILEAAHDEANQLEDLLMAFFDNAASVVIHMDPCREVICVDCLRDPCHQRSAPGHSPTPWTRSLLTGTAAARRREAPPAGITERNR
jgi:cation diffusion facilitator family transporter